MNTLTNVRLAFAYFAEQPIIHTEETLGNISKIKKMRVMVGSKPVHVPALSGNSFRGQLRDLLADRMFEVLSENGKRRIVFANNEVYGAIYSGGALREQSRLAGTMQRIKDTVPMIRLMGAAFGNVMLPSKLAATHIVPCTQETRGALASVVGELGEGVLLPESEWPAARDLIFNDGPLTRKDDRRDPMRQRFVDLGPVPADEPEPSQQMIYYVECIPAGTWLAQQLYTKYPLDQLELGCLFDGLGAWLQTPTLGGRSAAGYGQVRVHVRGLAGSDKITWPKGCEWGKSIEEAVGAYRRYLKEKSEGLLQSIEAEVKGTGDAEAEKTT